ncbi:O-antigen ligase family protein [Jeotgalibaca porci]|uniref:O-antigen ligase family protein n=1 Tax=Jeotgalibaca porci TaxID=1868793 RepID=UPI00359FADBB
MITAKKIWGHLMDPGIFRIVNLVIYIFYFVPSDFNAENIPMKITFVWGGVILAWDFFTKRIMFKQPYWYVLLALCVSYLFSIVTNFPHNFLDSAYNLVYLATSVFLFYAIDPKLPKEKRVKQFQTFNDVGIIIIFALTLLSLLTFVFNVAYTVPTGTVGVIARQGFIESRLFGMFTSPNMGSMIGYVSVLMMVVNNHLKRGSWRRFSKFYIVNAISQYLYYILANSRGTQITLVAFLIFTYIIWTYKVIASKKNIGKGIIRNFIILATIFFGVNAANTVLEFGLSYIPSSVSFLMSSPESETIVNEDGETVVVERRKPIKKTVIQHSEEGSEVSSGRLSIWAAGLKLLQQKPIFGVADSDVYRSGELSGQLDESQLSDLDIRELQRAHGNMHNTYVAVLVKAGIVGFLLLAIFVILILKDNIKFIGNKKFDFADPNNQLYLIIFTFILSLFVNDVVENHLIFNNRDVMGLVFWSYLGLTNHLRMEKEGI